ncbi:MAG: L,D-transpeptidase family protein [Methylobacterium frigidaeris]
MVLRQRVSSLRPGRSGIAALAWLAGCGAVLAQAPAPVPPAAIPADSSRPPESAPLPVGPVRPSAAEAEKPPVTAAPSEPARAVDAAKPADAVKAAEPAKKPSRELPPVVLARISQDPSPVLTPATFLDTLRMADRYQAIAEAGGWPELPADLAIRPGERNPAVPALRRHLVLTGDLAAEAPASDVLDPALVAAVRRFQVRHGLPDSGLVARLTVKALNVPAATRQRQLAASAARLMGSSFPFGDRYVVVNIPSATVEAVEHGTLARRYVAVVGKPDRASPLVETRITNVNFNPTWTVPVSLIKKDIIPHMRKDPGYLARMHIRMLDGQGNEVQPTAVDWSTAKAVNYTLRQDPGFDNSLGQVRIDMPNRHAVYMHDTPSKSLFSRDGRFHSSGCVRVAEVKELVGWLLDGTPGPGGPGTAWGPMEIETGIATGERRDLKLARPVPVTFVYMTGYATPDGRAHFRDDVYGLDSGPPAAAPAPPVAAPAARPAADPATTATITKRPAPAADATRPAVRPQPAARPPA